MSLLDLPPELLDAVISHTFPSGIEAFASSCRTVHVRAASHLRRHKALKRQWNTASLAAIAGARRDDIEHLIYAFARDPLAAQYVESLSLVDRRGADSVPFDDDDDHVIDFRADPEAVETIRRALLDTGYLESARVDAEYWLDRVLGHHDGGPIYYAVVTLLALLPNLKRLELPPGRWGGFNPYEDAEDYEKNVVSVLDAMVAAANTVSLDGANKPLGKLETMLPFMPEGYEMRAGLQSLEPFMRLQSMREIYAVSCVAVEDGYTGIPFQWRAPGVPSPIQRLELVSCCIDAEGLDALVSHMPSLTTFKYSHQTKWHGCLHDWNPGAFVETLGNHCGRSLRHLSLTIDELFGAIVNGLSTFFAFPHLESLEVDVRVFCGPPVESGQQFGSHEAGSEGITPWAREDIPCLGSMLPESIREVDLNIDFPAPDHVALEALLKNIKSHRSSRLRRLERFVVRQYNGDSCRSAADKVGVVFEEFDGLLGSESPIFRFMMPLWKRAFEEKVGGFLDEESR